MWKFFIKKRFFLNDGFPKWFGERPGKKAGAPDTPEGEEDEAEGAVAEEAYEEEEEEEDYDEEEE